MDGFSLIIGGIIGVLAGWAFSSAAHKQRDASRKLRRATRAKEEVSQKKGEIKNIREGSLSDVVQVVFLNLLGFGLIVVMGIILFNSLI